jgi:outer membrane protein
MKKISACLLLLLLPVSAWAQSTIPPQEPADAAAPSRLRIGVGVVAADNAYVGRGNQVTPFPLIQYEGDRFFFRGIMGGVHVVQSGALTVDAIVTTGFNTIDAKDFSASALARRGIDRNDLQDRDRSINAGVAATWKSAAGQLQLQAKTDISGTNEGQEYSLRYGYALRMSGFTITPTVGATFLSRNVANYYYGIHPVEVARGVPDYQPGGSLIPEVGVSLVRPIGASWALMINAQYRALPDKISNSPLVDGDRATSVFVAISRAL